MHPTLAKQENAAINYTYAQLVKHKNIWKYIS